MHKQRGRQQSRVHPCPYPATRNVWIRTPWYGEHQSHQCVRRSGPSEEPETLGCTAQKDSCPDPVLLGRPIKHAQKRIGLRILEPR